MKEQGSKTPESLLETEKRKAYLEALATSFGVKPLIADIVVTGIFEKKEHLKQIYHDFKDIDRAANPTSVSNTIWGLGSLFLQGRYEDLNPRRVGELVLGLLIDDIESELFTSFIERVGALSDIEARNTAQRYLERQGQLTPKIYKGSTDF